MMNRTVFVLGMMAVLCAGESAIAAQPVGRTVSLDIPARPLGDALAEFGKQADITIVFMGTDLKQGATSRALTGKFSPQAALAKLLEGTGLRYEYLDEKTIAIRGQKDGEKASGVSPADQMRVAMMEEEKKAQEAAGGEKETGFRFGFAVVGSLKRRREG